MLRYDYDKILKHNNVSTVEDLSHLLEFEVMHEWVESYKQESFLHGEVTFQRYYDFLFGYDHTFIEDNNISALPDSRVVFAFGITTNSVGKSNRRLMRKFWGTNAETFGHMQGKYDKGHFISHISGGPIDINLFPQRRDVNRGWSAEGKLFRKMEKNIASQSGTLVFARPIYNDFSCCPAYLEFGYYTLSGHLEVNILPNKY